MKNPYKNVDFNTLYTSDFKEDTVREVLILPMLEALGYDYSQIIRSKTLQHPFLKIGSKKRPINLVPDYLLKIGENYAWVLDAKAPNENITDGENVEQVYSYAIHPEVRTKFFALCNGKEFVLFRQDEKIPLLYFPLAEISQHWKMLERYLAVDAFQAGKSEKNHVQYSKYDDFEYVNRPLLPELPIKKQGAKRHFGVHGYFTKQTWNVVQEYIRNFSQVGDVILDPFGGSGVTAIEAFMTERKAIHIDLNPLSVFMVDALVAHVNNGDLRHTFERIKTEFEKNKPETPDQIEKALEKYPYPKGFKLPKNSDVELIEQLFTDKQLAQLAYLKFLIKKHTKKENQAVFKSLMLAFSSTLNKFNKTFHYTPKKIKDKENNVIDIDETKHGGGGNSGVFIYYRYRVAPKPADLNLMKIFEKKIDNVTAAKKEIAIKSSLVSSDEHFFWIKAVKGNAADLKTVQLPNAKYGLKGIANESVDYIYTDPPYGKKIPYLDLSTMWNAWLDLEVTKEDFELEAIEGGEHHKTKESYNELISKSIQEMYRVLKFDRWLSFVFAHKDPEFWHLIIETAEKCGFEYAGAVKQGNGQASFKKRQNPFTIVTGQLIINFKKVRKPKAIMKAALGMNIAEIMIQTCEGLIAANNGATLEQINDELIIKGLELGFLDLLKKEYSDLTPFLLDTFDYDSKTELFTIRKNTKFRTHVDLNLRVRYYLISFLRRMELEKKYPSFDKIVWHIMPLLKNGITPENQTILNVLENIAEKVGENAWKLKEKGQGSLFGK